MTPCAITGLRSSLLAGIGSKMVGTVTALLSVVALYLGRRFGAALGKRPDLVGGLLLIGIGGKVLVQHWLG
jgi:putative Mn2+ efflux pump MntP